MNTYLIRGGRKLNGSIKIHGAKNSVLPILAATIISGGESVIHNCPDLTDVDASLRILRHLGCSVKWDGDTITVDSSTLSRCDIPDNLMHEMRSSVIFLGAILARTGHAAMTYPGGCELGERPIDLHLKALRELGADIEESEGHIICNSAQLVGREIRLELPSVGATENVMLAACVAKGRTVIKNAAREPEIEDLSEFLKSMGAEIYGAGGDEIVIDGVNKLGNAEHVVIADRIVAATFLCCTAAAGGEINIWGVEPRRFQTVTSVLDEAGCEVSVGSSNVRLRRTNGLKSVRKIVTQPYPGFPTDAQAPVMAVLLKAKGCSVIEENIFDNRFKHAAEMMKMGAKIKIVGKTAKVEGVEMLHGADVTATDLRGGAALVVAALSAEGESVVRDIAHIDRGYHYLENSLKVLGADIVRA